MNSSLTRRSLLYRSAAVVATVHTAGLTRLFAADARSKPGVQMYMVAAEFKKDPAGTLAKLAAIGYGYVEAFAMAIANIAEFKKMVADAGLGCPSGHFALRVYPDGEGARRCGRTWCEIRGEFGAAGRAAQG